ncbi:MAG: hypothetical protein RIS45_1900 [Planctomycetota bacterium]|jgi:hypothetical protein
MEHNPVSGLVASLLTMRLDLSSVRVEASRRDVRAAVAAIDGMCRAYLTPKGLAGVPAFVAVRAGLDAVPPVVGDVVGALGRALEGGAPIVFRVEGPGLDVEAVIR